MMRKLVFLVIIGSLLACNNNKKEKMNSIAVNNAENQQIESIYQFKVKTLVNDDFDFASLKGKKIMIVNTASKCGLTPQYKDLQSLYNTYKEENFVIIGFPANNFSNQEPGTNAEIAEFCQLNYGVNFPMMAKISVKGEDMHPMYQFLTQKTRNGFEDSEVTWNFQKYLIDENGVYIDYFYSMTKPMSSKITKYVE